MKATVSFILTSVVLASVSYGSSAACPLKFAKQNQLRGSASIEKTIYKPGVVKQTASAVSGKAVGRK